MKGGHRGTEKGRGSFSENTWCNEDRYLVPEKNPRIYFHEVQKDKGGFLIHQLCKRLGGFFGVGWGGRGW